MIKILMVLIISTLLCGCSSVIEEYPIDARYTESYQGIETTYDYEFDLFSENGFKKMPNVHSTIVPEKYELQYRINYDDKTTRTEWRTVTKDEYNNFIKESSDAKNSTSSD